MPVVKATFYLNLNVLIKSYKHSCVIYLENEITLHIDIVDV
jgi:hypothetical protein